MLGTPSCPLPWWGAGVHLQERKMEEGVGREPCHRALGRAFLEGGDSASMHFSILNIFPGICHPGEYSVGGLVGIQ